MIGLNIFFVNFTNLIFIIILKFFKFQFCDLNKFKFFKKSEILQFSKIKKIGKLEIPKKVKFMKSKSQMDYQLNKIFS